MSEITVPRLATYTRTETPFAEVFGASPREVLAAMDAAGDDIPSRRPPLALGIDAVGMWRHDVVVPIHDPFGSGELVSAICAVKIDAHVPPTHRGIHVSRIGTLLAERAGTTFADVADYATQLAQAVASAQYGRAVVEVRARVPFVESPAPDWRSSAKPSLEHLDHIVRVAVGPSRIVRDFGIRISHIVACPCVQQTFKHALQPRGETAGALEAAAPAMTHSQRCVTTVMVRKGTGSFVLPDVLAGLDAVLVRTRNTLPRDLELLCVYRAHRHPQFIEDALRAAVTALATAIAPQMRFSALSARSISQESIHDFDLRARMHVTAATLRAAHASGADEADDMMRRLVSLP